jgi:3-deoxy-D-manno-octulosonic-acid transferase
LENFINNNPEYQIDFDAWKNSVVQDDQMKYKYVDELLVNERFSPKGWFKWASGGALFFGLVFASALLMNKFDGGEDRLNALGAEKNNYINKSEGSLAKNQTSDASGELQDKISIATNERVVQKELNKNTLPRKFLINKQPE